MSRMCGSTFLPNSSSASIRASGPSEPGVSSRESANFQFLDGASAATIATTAATHGAYYRGPDGPSAVCRNCSYTVHFPAYQRAVPRHGAGISTRGDT